MEIKINKIEQKVGTASGKPFWIIGTNKGPMSAFDNEITDQLYEYWQKNVTCYVDAEPSKDGKYVNIRKLMTFEENEAYEEANKNYDASKKNIPLNQENRNEMRTAFNGLGVSSGKPEVVKPWIHEGEETQSGQIIKPNETVMQQFNPTSMYVAYAKDIFICLINNAKDHSDPKRDILKFDVIMAEAINLVKQAHKEFTL